jgi:anaerobic ribonucleoside-triphosphate reductase activating protein
MPDSLNVYLKVPRTRALGPGLRFALWVQGCPRRCPGCMTPGSLPLSGGTTMTVDDLAEEILRDPDLEGLTISGGEPFSQAAALTRLIDSVRARRSLGVIVYTGHRLEALSDVAVGDPQHWVALLSRVDLLVDGPYDARLDDGRRLRGSSNQRAIALTTRYSSALADYGAQGRTAEIHLGGADVVLVGVPGTELLARWQAAFAETVADG